MGLLQEIVPAADAETLDALAPALKAIESAEKMMGVDASVPKSQLIQDFLNDILSAGGVEEQKALFSDNVPVQETLGSNFDDFGLRVEVLGQDPFIIGIDNQQYPADLLVQVVSDTGAETYHQINEDLGLHLNGSPYTIRVQSNLEPEILKEVDLVVECSVDAFIVERLQ